ncbi:MAG: Uma2 family endonuclease [Caldilineaceae bacterium]
MFAAKMKPRLISPEEYLQQEEISTDRHEYFKGEVFLMAGGSHNHEMICGGILSLLRQQARRKKCTAYGSNMKIQVKSSGLFTYPDAMLVCGKIEFAAERKDVITNPLLIVEVLSSSTQSYDRGDKFALYRGLPSFAHYLLIHQDEPLIEYHQKTRQGWLLTETAGIDATLNLETIELSLPLRELYEGVDWLENDQVTA